MNTQTMQVLRVEKLQGNIIEVVRKFDVRQLSHYVHVVPEAPGEVGEIGITQDLYQFYLHVADLLMGELLASRSELPVTARLVLTPKLLEQLRPAIDAAMKRAIDQAVLDMKTATNHT